MTKIPTFDAVAPRRAMLEVQPETGTTQVWEGLARTSRDITSRLLESATKARDRERLAEAHTLASAAEMPSVDYAFDGTSAATSPSQRSSAQAMTRGMSGEVRSIITEAAQRHGVDPNAMLTIAMLESSGNPAARNPNSSAGGLFQFIDGTAKQYNLADRFDPRQASDAAARLARDNAAHLKRALGRDPTPGELYLAHQQGAEGAARLLSNPDARAASIVGEDAVRLNAGRSEMTAGEFARMWTGKAEGARTTSAAGGAKLSVQLTGKVGPVPRVESGTITGDRFNAAALDIYVNRLEVAMRAQMEAVAAQHPADPAELANALEALRAGYLSELPPEGVRLINLSFERTKAGLVAGAARNFHSNVESENLASFEEAIEARKNNAFRLASRMELTEEADRFLEAELEQIDRDIEASPHNPVARQQLRRRTRNSVISARILGGFGVLSDPDDRVEFAERFREEWQDGKGFGGALDFKTFQEVQSEMVKTINADRLAAGQRTTALQRSIDGQINVLKRGWPVPAAQREALQHEVARTGDEELVANLEFLDGLAAWQSAHLTAHPSAVEAQLNELRARMQREGATPAALATQEVMEGLLQEMSRGLERDPLTWANRAGLIELTPLDFGNANALVSSLSSRAATAEAVAQHYGAEPRYFTPVEAEGLRKLVEGDPLAMPGLVSTLREGLGDALPGAMSEISDEAPVLAHVAGLYTATGEQRFTLEVAEALEMRRMEGYRANLPPVAQLHSAANEVIGGALWLWPAGRSAAIETATLAFERRAARAGVDVSNFNQPGDAARQMFAQALDEALGATFRQGVKYGGMTTVNGTETVAPADMPANELESLMLNIAEDDLMFQGRPPSTRNGVPITIAQMRRSRLVHVGGSQYRVALADPMSDDPRYLGDGAGGYWLLDASMLWLTAKERLPAGPLDSRGRWQSQDLLREWQDQLRDPSKMH